jgi:hypothetical protein
VQTPRKRWETHFRDHLARTATPPASVQLRVGQGAHLLVRDAEQNLLHLIVSTAADPAPSWWSSAISSLRYYARESALHPHERAWLDAAREAVLTAEALADWAPFLDDAARKAGISVAQGGSSPAEAITSGEELVVRLLEPCNARCDFCGCIGVMNDATFDLAAAQTRLQDGFSAGFRRVVFTGGEPTLLKDLPAYVRLARALGYQHVNLQTNGVRLADRERCADLAAAGLDSILLSLHSHRASVHDHVLKLPGAFDGAVAAIDHCIDVGIKVHLNFVLHDENLPDLLDYLTFVYRRFDRQATPTWHGHVGVTLSFVSPIGWTLEHLDRVPRITDAAPVLAEALTLAEALGLEVHVPGLCGLPMCTMPGFEAYFDENRGGTPPKLDTRTKLDVCTTCPHEAKCSGYWKVYFDLYGTDEIGPGARPWGRDGAEPEPAPALLGALRKLLAAGKSTFEISQLLNSKRVRTPRGGRWTDDRVMRLLRSQNIPFTEAAPQRERPA